MARKSNSQRVPLVIVETPSLAQAALMKMSTLPPAVDPYLLSTKLKQIASDEGAQFISTLDAFKMGPGANQVFYVADTHLNAEGQGLVSHVLIDELMKTQRPALLGL